MKKNNIVTLIIAIIIPLVVGGMSSFLTKDAMMIFDSVKKPPLSPHLVWMTFAGYLNIMIAILNK